MYKIEFQFIYSVSLTRTKITFHTTRQSRKWISSNYNKLLDENYCYIMLWRVYIVLEYLPTVVNQCSLFMDIHESDLTIFE